MTGCTTNTDPTIPCGQLNLAGSAQTLVARSANVLAFTTANEAAVTVVVDACNDPEVGCDGPQELEERKVQVDEAPDSILLTGTGEFLVTRNGQTLTRWDVACGGDNCTGQPFLAGDEQQQLPVDSIVGTLRSDDWAVFRSDGRLYAQDARHEELDAPLRLGEDPNLLAVAMGDRNIVARRILGDDREQLFLLRVNPTRRHALGGHASAGDAIFLGEGKSFSRVLITRGRTPAALGETDEPDADTPIDEYVIATSGTGEDATTVIFRTLDGEPMDAFEGEALSGHLPLQELPGLSALSADNSHLAYVTPSGALAMRNLGSQGACLVRPASSGRHTIAGFAPDGTLYFESEEDGPDGHLTHRIGAYDPRNVTFHWLSGDDYNSRLRAVPLAQPRNDAGKRVPWAVTNYEGLLGVQEDDSPQPLGLDPHEISFLPRETSDDSMWLLEASEDRVLRLKKIRVGADADDQTLLEFDARDSDPVSVDEDGNFTPFEKTFTRKDRICVAAARPGGWGASCSRDGDPASLLRSGPEEAPSP
jgi:hypothetical protein